MKPESEKQYREFVAARLDRLGRFAYVLCRDWHQAEDIVQKALIKLYVHWPKASIRSPEAYVRRIIANAIIDDRRLGWFRREKTTGELPERSFAPHEGRAERLTVLDALATLPKRQRLAIVLRYWEDLTVEQTAAVLGCAPGTVKSQTARGLARLRDLLGDDTVTMKEGALR